MSASLATVPVFSLRRLRFELLIDALIRRGVIALLVVVVVLAGVGLLGPWGASAVGLAVMGCWIVWGLGHASLLRRVRSLGPVIETQPGTAEAELASLLRRRGLGGWARLMLYQSLAAVRYRQQRFAEVAAIGAALHPRKLGPGEQDRVTLLLMAAEARLHCGDPVGAWQTLWLLYGLPMSLQQAAQRLALSTRYMVAVGHDHAALWQLDSKLPLLELLPPRHAGDCHRWLAQSAGRLKQQRLSEWLTQRGTLFSGTDGHG